MTTLADPPSAYERILLWLRRALNERGMDDAADTDAVQRAAAEAVAWYQRAASSGQVPVLRDPEGTVSRLVLTITGYGPLAPLLAAGTGIEDIFIEGERVTYLADGHLRALREPVTETELRRLVEKLLAATEHTLDRSHPIVDGVQVLDGRARLTAAVPPVSDHLSADLRLYVNRYATLDGLVDNDTLSPAAASLLRLDVQARGSILIAGETGSGKSTVLAALLAELHPNHCVRLVEESRELQFRPVHGGRMQCAPAGRGTEPTGADSLGELVRLTLRMRCDVIAVGEVRGAEAWQLSRASSVGAGFLATIHASSAEDALEALVLTALGAGPNVSERLIRRTFGRSLRLVVFCERDDPNLLADGEPYLHQITEVRAVSPAALGDDQFSSEPLFVREDGLGSPLRWTGNLPHSSLVRDLERQLPTGATLHDVLTGKLTP